MITALKDFLLMGGYANYVWSSYGIAFIILLMNIWWSHRYEKRVKTFLTQWYKGNQS